MNMGIESFAMSGLYAMAVSLSADPPEASPLSHKIYFVILNKRYATLPFYGFQQLQPHIYLKFMNTNLKIN